MVSLTHTSQPPKRHLDRFSCFCTLQGSRTWPTDRHTRTDRQTTLLRL